MVNEAWLNGKLDGYTPLMMPAAHALTQSAIDLQKFAANLTFEELTARPNAAPSVGFHLKHIAGSIDRLLTYARGEDLSAAQFDFLNSENFIEADSNAAQLIEKAVETINTALAVLQTTAPESLFQSRFVGRQKLPTNVFGLLFHIAEHTARHVGQIVTTVQIVQIKENSSLN